MLWIFHFVFIFLKQQHQQQKIKKKEENKKEKKAKNERKSQAMELEKNFLLCVVVEFVRWWGKSLLRKSNKKAPKQCISSCMYIYLLFFVCCMFVWFGYIFYSPPRLSFFCWWPQNVLKKIPTANFCSRYFFVSIFC